MIKSIITLIILTVLTGNLWGGGEPEEEAAMESNESMMNRESEATEDSGPSEMGTMVTMDIPYTVDGEEFIGYLAYDASINQPVPAILVVHEWQGINAYARKRAEDLAEEGFVGFAVDLYGGGLEVPRSEAPSMSRSVGSDFPLIKSRMEAALELVKGYEQVNPESIAAIGYCFGGGIVLNMARMGTDMDGVVSFHGSLNTGLTAEVGDIQTKVLAIQGDLDPVAPPDAQEAFRAEMVSAEADFEYIIYEDVAAHNFTNPEGSTYFPVEAEFAWSSMLSFFDTLF